jgi:hypothetical protein
MHSVEILEEACAAAQRLGYRIRQEWLDGAGGGDCEFGGTQWIFLDLSQTAPEQLETVLSVLRRDPRSESLSPISPSLLHLYRRRKAA